MKVLKDFSAFTLAELISVIIVLGIVAAIIIPSTVKRHSELIKRTTIKKALAAYNTAVEKIIIEQGLRSTKELDNWAKGSGDCAPVRQYFKAIETANGGCRFRTADKLWWDMGTAGNNSSLTKTFVAFKSEDLNWSGKKMTLLNNSDAFCFTSSFDDNGSLRIYDLSYALNKCDRSQLMTSIKLHHFLNKTKDIDGSVKECNSSITGSCYVAVKNGSGQRTGKYTFKNDAGEGCYTIETNAGGNSVNPFDSINAIPGSGGRLLGEHGWTFTSNGITFNEANGWTYLNEVYCDVSAIICAKGNATISFSQYDQSQFNDLDEITKKNIGSLVPGNYSFNRTNFSYTCPISKISGGTASSCRYLSNEYVFRTGDNPGDLAIHFRTYVDKNGNTRYQVTYNKYNGPWESNKDAYIEHPGGYYTDSETAAPLCCDANFANCKTGACE